MPVTVGEGQPGVKAGDPPRQFRPKSTQLKPKKNTLFPPSAIDVFQIPHTTLHCTLDGTTRLGLDCARYTMYFKPDLVCQPNWDKVMDRYQVEGFNPA